MYNRITLKQLQRMAPSVSITYTQKKTKKTCEIKCNETREHFSGFGFVRINHEQIICKKMILTSHMTRVDSR